MRKSVLLLSVLAVACMPIPGLDGRSGPEGAIGETGSAGRTGTDGTEGTDAEVRTGRIAYVVPDRLNAGQEVMIQVVGHYTDWTEGAEAVVDYPGVEVVGTQALGPVTLGVTLRVATDVVAGAADLQIGELSLPSAFQVAPAAWFEFDEGYQNPVAPGAEISGTIHLNGAYGIPVREAWRIELIGHRGGLIVEGGQADGNDLTGYKSVNFQARLGAQVPAGPKSLAITVDNEVVVPVPNAIEIADVTPTGLVLDQAAPGDLADGDAIFSMNLEEGSILRFAVEGGDFTPAMSLTRPPVDEEERLLRYSNEQPELEAFGQVLEVIVPKSGAWYLVVSSTEALAEDASGAFTLTMEALVAVPGMNRRHQQNLAGPGHGAWFAGTIAEGNLLGWRIVAPEGSETSPVARYYFTGEINGENRTGAALLVAQDPNRLFLRSDAERQRFGLASGLTGQLTWQVLDAQLRGGEDHHVDFHFVAGPNGGAACADLEGLPIGIPREELGTVTVLGQLNQDNEDLGSMGCPMAGAARADMVYKIVLTQPRRLSYHLQTQGGSNDWRANWTPMVAIETECGNTETEVLCSAAGEGLDFAGADVAASATGGSADLQPGTYVIRVQHQDSMFGDFRLSFWLDLQLEEIPAP